MTIDCAFIGRLAQDATGGPCKATTKLGKPFRRRVMENGVCVTHGGRDAMQLWLAGHRLDVERQQQAEAALAGAISEAAERARPLRPTERAMQTTHDKGKPV